MLASADARTPSSRTLVPAPDDLPNSDGAFERGATVTDQYDPRNRAGM